MNVFGEDWLMEYASKPRPGESVPWQGITDSSLLLVLVALGSALPLVALGWGCSD